MNPNPQVFDDLKAACNLLEMLQSQNRRHEAGIIETVAIRIWLGR